MTDIKDGYTRVSDILRIFSKYDAVPEDKLAIAAQKGDAVHTWIASYIRSKDGLFPVSIDDLDEMYHGYGFQFLEWYDIIGEHEVYALEERFYDDELKITGQCDLILKKENKYILVDFKTTYAKSKDWGLQLAAYSYLIMRNRSVSFDDMQILHLRKEGGFKIYSYDFTEQFPIFMKCVDLYNYFNAKKRRAQGV